MNTTPFLPLAILLLAGSGCTNPDGQPPLYEGPCDHLQVPDQAGSIVIQAWFDRPERFPGADAKLEDGTAILKRLVSKVPISYEDMDSTQLDVQGCAWFQSEYRGGHSIFTTVRESENCFWEGGQRFDVEDRTVFLDVPMELSCVNPG